MGIQPKLKLCNGPCNSLKHIWKCEGSDRYCRDCWRLVSDKPKLKPTAKRKPIAPRSSKQAKKDAAYKILRDIFMKNHPMCEAKLPGCSSTATDIHHLYGGKDRSKYYLDSGTWRSICRPCHTFCHDKLSSEEAIELGLKLVDNG